MSTATPKRVSARLSVRLEDIAAIGAENFEMALRQNLAMALSDELDNQAINGDGTAPNLAGILSRLTNPTSPTAVADFDAFVTSFADSVDGLWAATVKDVSVVCARRPTSFPPARSATSLRRTWARRRSPITPCGCTAAGGRTRGCRDPLSNVQKAILHRRGQMGMRTATLPHWGMISIDDIYSGSAAGERHFTLHTLLGDVILVQPNAYAELEYRVA